MQESALMISDAWTECKLAEAWKAVAAVREWSLLHLIRSNRLHDHSRPQYGTIENYVACQSRKRIAQDNPDAANRDNTRVLCVRILNQP